jgi:hypothetical protein
MEAEARKGPKSIIGTGKIPPEKGGEPYFWWVLFPRNGNGNHSALG